MECPYCGYSELKVTDSRNVGEMNAIRRRRECQNCTRRFTTFETLEVSLQVQKRDGKYEDFQEQKLINGLEAACHHTSISRDQVRRLACQITQKLMEGPSRTVTTTEVGESVMEHLQAQDTVAYIRFACVYRRLKNLQELMEAIQSIQAKDEKAKHSVPVHG